MLVQAASQPAWGSVYSETWNYVCIPYLTKATEKYTFALVNQCAAVWSKSDLHFRTAAEKSHGPGQGRRARLHIPAWSATQVFTTAEGQGGHVSCQKLWKSRLHSISPEFWLEWLVGNCFWIEPDAEFVWKFTESALNRQRKTSLSHISEAKADSLDSHSFQARPTSPTWYDPTMINCTALQSLFSALVVRPWVRISLPLSTWASEKNRNESISSWWSGSLCRSGYVLLIYRKKVSEVLLTCLSCKEIRLVSLHRSTSSCGYVLLIYTKQRIWTTDYK